jgi:hypothetical protein
VGLLQIENVSSPLLPRSRKKYLHGIKKLSQLNSHNKKALECKVSSVDCSGKKTHRKGANATSS